MRVTFYAAVMSVTAYAIQLENHTHCQTEAEDGLGSAIQMDPEFDDFMFAQTYSDLDVVDDEAAKVQKVIKAAAETDKAKAEAEVIKKVAEKKQDEAVKKAKAEAD